jgi:predicted amidohydrolase
MTDPAGVSRRDFLRRSLAGAGAATGLGADDAARPEAGSPREVWVAALSQAGLEAEDPREMARLVLAQLESVTAFQPDLVCLPETVLFTRVRRLPDPAAAAALSPELERPLAEFARRAGCYLVLPTYTRSGGRVYNASVVYDRHGERIGEYRKMRPAEEEMAAGVSPGPPDPPVFHTDFGVLGAQVCFDIEWPDGWRALRAKGAELVAWSSAFAGGEMVNTAAWQHKVAVVASTRKDTTKICDVSGEELARTGRWSPYWAVAPLNLEKVFLHTYPYNRHFDAIHAKYGRRVRLTTHHEEEWTILESRSPEVRVAEVMREFGLKSHEETTRSAELLHEAAWRHP